MKGERYFDSVNPCPTHGMTERYRKTGVCVQCSHERNRSVSQEAKAKYRLNRKEQREAARKRRPVSMQQALIKLREHEAVRDNAELVALIDGALSSKRAQ